MPRTWPAIPAILVALLAGCTLSQADPAPTDEPDVEGPIVPPADLVPGSVAGYLVDDAGELRIAAALPPGASPVGGAAIRAFSHDGLDRGAATTDGAGRFLVGGLPPRLVRIEATRQGSTEPDVAVEATVVPSVTIELGREYAVSRDAAVEMALEGATAGALVVGTLNPLPKGVVLYPRLQHDGLPTSLLDELPEDSWLFWTDPDPVSLYRHDVEYTIVGAETGVVSRLASPDQAMVNHGGLWGSRDHLFLYSPHYTEVDEPPPDASVTATAEVVQLPQLTGGPDEPDSRDIHPAPYEPEIWDMIADIPVDGEPAMKPLSHFNNRGSDGVFVVLIRAGEEDLFRQDVNRLAFSLWTGILDNSVPLANMAKMSLPDILPPAYTVTGMASQDAKARTQAMNALIARAVLHFEPQIQARLDDGMHSTLIVYLTGHGGGGEVAAQFKNDQTGAWGVSADSMPVTQTKACRVRVIVNSCESGKMKDALQQKFQASEHDVTLYSSTSPDDNGLGTPGFLTYVPFANLVKQGGSQFTTVASSLAWVENGDILGLYQVTDEGVFLHEDLAVLEGSPPEPYFRPSHPSWCFPEEQDSGVSPGDAGDSGTTLPDGSDSDAADDATPIDASPEDGAAEAAPDATSGELPSGVSLSLPSFLGNPEGLYRIAPGWAELPSSEPLMVVAGTGAWAIVRMASGQWFTPPAPMSGSFYGALPLHTSVNDAIVMFGPQSMGVSIYEPSVHDFGMTAVLNGNFTDVTPVAGASWSTAAGYLSVDNAAGTVTRARPDPQTGNYSDTDVVYGDAFPGAGMPVSAYSPGASGPAIVVADGLPGNIFIHDFASSTAPAVLVSSSGNSPRRVRCALPLCAVSNYDSGTLSIISWSGSGTSASHQGDVPVGDGPIGIDIIPAASNYAVASTGYGDDTVSVTILTSAGNLVESTKTPVPAGCTSPGHAIFVPDTNGTKVLLTCNGTKNYAIVEAGF